MHIPEYLNGTWTNHTPRRRRKLLLHRPELDKICHKTRESGHTIVPLALYFKDGRAKVEIAVAKGKKAYDKRHALRERQDNREAQRALHSHGKATEVQGRGGVPGGAAANRLGAVLAVGAHDGRARRLARSRPRRPRLPRTRRLAVGRAAHGGQGHPVPRRRRR